MDRYYVYCFVNEDWHDIFYIGKGCRNRYKDIETRNQHTKQIWLNHNCKTKILRDGLTEEEAFKVEHELKEWYKMNGSPIIDNEYSAFTQMQRAGIEKAKSRGTYKGRQPIKIDEEKFKSVCKRWRVGEITAKQAQKELDLKPDTFYRRVKQFKV